MFAHSLIHKMIHARFGRRARYTEAVAMCMTIIRQRSLIADEVVSKIEETTSKALKAPPVATLIQIIDYLGTLV
jgi:hypothetical protein